MDFGRLAVAVLAGLAGTLVLRPYVFAFLTAYGVAAVRDLGWRRAGHFAAWTFTVAWTSEFASTRVGVPFGLYHYSGATRGGELFIADVPFFDSASFVFLAYASYCLARLALRRARGPGVVSLAAVAMMLLDVVIDPLAVRGDRWFLGRIFYYAEEGPVFGVPLPNFIGWVIVGGLAVGGFLLSTGDRPVGSPVGGGALYYGVLGFSLAVASYLGEPALVSVGLLVHAGFLLMLWCLYAERAGGKAACTPRSMARSLARRARS